jgi:hypothetical protein
MACCLFAGNPGRTLHRGGCQRATWIATARSANVGALVSHRAWLSATRDYEVDGVALVHFLARDHDSHLVIPARVGADCQWPFLSDRNRDDRLDWRGVCEWTDRCVSLAHARTAGRRHQHDRSVCASSVAGFPRESPPVHRPTIAEPAVSDRTKRYRDNVRQRGRLDKPAIPAERSTSVSCTSPAHQCVSRSALSYFSFGSAFEHVRMMPEFQPPCAAAYACRDSPLNPDVERHTFSALSESFQIGSAD